MSVMEYPRNHHGISKKIFRVSGTIRNGLTPVQSDPNAERTFQKSMKFLVVACIRKSLHISIDSKYLYPGACRYSEKAFKILMRCVLYETSTESNKKKQMRWDNFK